MYEHEELNLLEQGNYVSKQILTLRVMNECSFLQHEVTLIVFGLIPHLLYKVKSSKYRKMYLVKYSRKHHTFEPTVELGYNELWESQYFFITTVTSL